MAKIRNKITRELIQEWGLYALVMLWVARNTFLIRRREGDLYDAVDTMAIFQIALVGAIVMVILLTPLKKDMARALRSSLKFYFLYYALAAVSILWSVNGLYSLYRAGEVMALSSAVLIFCSKGSDLDKSVSRTGIMIWSVVLMIVLDAFLKGVFRNNTLGAAGAMTACFYVSWLLAGRRNMSRRQWVQIGVGVAIVLVSLSLASWWSFWFGICYCAFFTRRKAIIVALVMIGIVIFFSLGTDTRDNLLIRDKDYEDIEGLTGRKMMWENYWVLSEYKPVLGFGFAVGAREVGYIYNTNTHNMFFGALLGLGWVGVTCWVLFFGLLARELLQYRHSRVPVWLGCAAGLSAGTMNSMSLSLLAEQWNPSTTVFVALLGLHLRFLTESRKRVHHPQKALTGRQVSSA